MKCALGAAGLVCAVTATFLPAALGAGVAPTKAGPSEGTMWTLDGKKVVDVPLAHTEVRIRVSGYLADVDVTQTFTNPFDRKIEAVYAFPLPTGAAVNRLRLKAGDEVVEGKLHARAEASLVYKAAKEAGKVAALLEEERANLFTQSVANLEPGATVEVSLHYVQELPYDHGAYELVFPMVASPRYIPGAAKAAPPKGAAGTHADTDRVADASRVTPLYLPPDTRSSHDVGLTVELDAGVPVRDVRSPSHRIDVAEDGPARARVTLAAGDTVPNKDFVLRYDVAGAAPEVALLAHRGAADAKGAFFLMVQPPAALADAAVAPRELVFVVDTSSSMEGAPLAKAKEVVRTSLGALLPDDTFQIIRFGDAASALGPAPLAAKARNVELALRWLDGLAAEGGTEMAAGVRAALDFPHDPARLRLVLFLTDGYIGNEDEVLATVHGHLGASRLFSFGVGTAVNRYLLEEMASFGRGTVEVVRPDEDTAAAVARFHARIARPVLTDVNIDWKGLAVEDLEPDAVPDLFLGQPLVVHGRYGAGGAATIVVTGKLGGRAVSFPVAVALPAREEAHEAVATVWAKARLREMARGLVRKDDTKLVAAITELALQYQLLSRYTSFVAVSAKTTAGGRAETVGVPLEAPEGLAAGKHVMHFTPGGAAPAAPMEAKSKAMTKGMDYKDVVGGLSGDYDGPAPPSAGASEGGGGLVGLSAGFGLGSKVAGATTGATGTPAAPPPLAKPESAKGKGSPAVAASSHPSADAGAPGKAPDMTKKATKEELASGDDIAARAKSTYAASVRKCYDGAVSRKSVSGKSLDVVVDVGADGRVVAASAPGVKDPVLDSCLGTVAKSWSFAVAKAAPAHDGGGAHAASAKAAKKFHMAADAADRATVTFTY